MLRPESKLSQNYFPMTGDDPPLPATGQPLWTVVNATCILRRNRRSSIPCAKRKKARTETKDIDHEPPHNHLGEHGVKPQPARPRTQHQLPSHPAQDRTATLSSVTT